MLKILFRIMTSHKHVKPTLTAHCSDLERELRTSQLNLQSAYTRPHTKDELQCTYTHPHTEDASCMEQVLIIYADSATVDRCELHA